jgi:hypothetical protein
VELAEIARRRPGRRAAGAAIGLTAATLCLVAVSSGWVYLTRSLADRYVNYTYELVAAAEEARDHPGAALIVEGYASYDVEFLAYGRMPALIRPGAKIANPSAYSEVVAISKNDLIAALGPELAGTAVPVAWDPSGKPAVWVVATSGAP